MEKNGVSLGICPLAFDKGLVVFPHLEELHLPQAGGLGEEYLGQGQHVGRAVPRLGVLYCTGTPGDALLAGRGCCCTSEVVLTTVLLCPWQGT